MFKSKSEQHLTQKDFVEPVNVEAFYINDHGNSELKEYKSIDDTLCVQSVHASMELKEIYQGLKL